MTQPIQKVAESLPITLTLEKSYHKNGNNIYNINNDDDKKSQQQL